MFTVCTVTFSEAVRNQNRAADLIADVDEALGTLEAP
jgi:hypothetical protein